MQIQVNQDKLTLIQEEQEVINSGAIDYYRVDITFDNSWDNLIKEVILRKKGEEKGEQINVINNNIYLNINKYGRYSIGLVGYRIIYVLTTDTEIFTNKKYYTRIGTEGNYEYTEVSDPIVANISSYYESKKDYQISTNIEKIRIKEGTGEIECDEHEIPSISEWEIYIAQIQEMITGFASESDVAENTLDIIDLERTKVDKEEGKGLSTNDYTTEEKSKLAGLNNYDDTEIRQDITDLENNKANTTDIPTATSNLTNDSGFITSLVNNLINYTNNVGLPTAVRNVRPLNSSTATTIAVNTIYDLGEQTNLTLNLPTGQLGDFIQVDFLSTATPTTLTMTATSSALSDCDLIPEANKIYSLFFVYGRLETSVYGWKIAYSENTRTVV